MSGSKDVRTYQRADCAVFRKTAEAFGGLSNMAPGFPVRVNGVRILTVEALYQACRFPHRPEVQRKIIEQSSPMTAKMVGKPFRKDSRPDWDRVRVKIMRWVLRLKLAMHWSRFSELLLSTGDKPIVEDSRKDDFWGAVPVGDTSLVGMNVLGRLLMELREEVKQGGELRRVEPPAISNFRLFDEVLGIVDFRNKNSELFVAGAEKELPAVTSISLSLFDEEFIEETTKGYSVDPAPKPVFEQRSGLIADLKPYAAYRAAEGDWLGQVPSHWIVRRMKYVVQEKDSRSTTGDEQLLRVSQFTGVTQRLRAAGREEQDTRAASLIGYKRVELDELVVNIMLAWNGSMGVSRYPGIASPAYCVYSFSPDALPWYFHHLLRSSAYKARIKAMSTGVVESRLRLYSDDLFRIEALLPPREEQAAIVRFLDWANARLERTIRAKRRVIALLTEQKQAIIHRAVTRGLDSTVPLKPSGIAWLGDIPAHWGVMPIKRSCSHVRDGTHLPPPRTSTGFPLLSVRNIVNGRLIRRPDDSLISKSDFEQLNASFILQKNDVVIAIVGATLGKVAVVEDIGPFQIQRSVAFLRPRPKLIDHDFLATFLRSPKLQQHLWRSVAFSAQPGIYLGFVANIPVPVPPTVTEQTAIYEWLQRETAPVDTAVSRLKREIDFLREYRTRLVADVVTGKLDVRAAAAALPQDQEPMALEPDALDSGDGPEVFEESESDDEEAAI
jgi:type I restriction enzyme S subunit